jgi:FkbM family methyltransferase
VRDYPSDFGGCVVVDLGAHKGYFGLSAVLGGAREVISYEPAAANFALLERTARPFPRWTVHRAAVSTTSGRGVLTLSEESWTHSLRNVADPVGSEEVTLVGIGEVIRERACVKVDIEGLERAVLESGDWSTVDAVWVEVHDEADRVPIEAVLEHAGLERDDSPAGSRVLGFRRP